MKRKNWNRIIALVLSNIILLNSTIAIKAEFNDGVLTEDAEIMLEDNYENVEDIAENIPAQFEDGTKTKNFVNDSIEFEEQDSSSSLFTSGTSFSGNGCGTKETPYEITSPKQLNEIRNNLTAHYVLKKDIDLSEIENWMPIGGKENTFQGSFDGKNHVIKNLNIVYDKLGYEDYVGLFGYCKNANLQNINFENVYIMVDKINTDFTPNWGGNTYVGTIAGYSQDGSITNCCIDGTISVINCNSTYTGGIVGSGSNIKNCISNAKINVISNKEGRSGKDGTVYSGGITGYTNYADGNIDQCSNFGNISLYGPQVYGGGISGEHGNIKNSINKGDIKGKIEYPRSYSTPGGYGGIGGIIGVAHSTVTDCINYGCINGESIESGWKHQGLSVGGIAGQLGSFYRGVLKRCINVGNSITAKDKYGTSDIQNGRAMRISNLTCCANSIKFY